MCLVPLVKDSSNDLRVLTVNVTKINDYDYYNWQGEGTFLVVTVDWIRRGIHTSCATSFLIRFRILLSYLNSTLHSCVFNDSIYFVGVSPEVEECKSTLNKSSKDSLVIIAFAVKSVLLS